MTWENCQKSARWVGLFANLLTDGSYHLTNPEWIPDATVLVHEGFLHDFDRLKDKLYESIGRLIANRNLRKIEICGHSLGGALATLCALWCRNKWEEVPITCLTLASPRVGNEGFANFFKTCPQITCYRLFIPSDPVPNIPNQKFEWFPLRVSPKSPYCLACRGTCGAGARATGLRNDSERRTPAHRRLPEDGIDRASSNSRFRQLPPT
ncbi:Alpha/Beta hydrolase protein [Ilyonectria destructans]|nr:Alpha/Beta hydrolase protein [Ilyonectria destructans]